MINLFLFDKLKNNDLIMNNLNINKSFYGYIKINHKNLNNLKLLGKIYVLNNKDIENIKKILYKINKSYVKKKYDVICAYSMIYNKEYKCSVFI